MMSLQLSLLATHDSYNIKRDFQHKNRLYACIKQLIFEILLQHQINTITQIRKRLLNDRRKIFILVVLRHWKYHCNSIT